MSRALAKRVAKLEAMKEPPPVEMTDQEVVHRITAILNSQDEADNDIRQWMQDTLGVEGERQNNV